MKHPETTCSPKPLTLVMAANGKTGRRVAERLEERGVPLRRGSRSAEVPFDWDDPTTWEPALAGVEAAYVVYTPDLSVPAALEAIREFIRVAKRSGVRRLVLLSGRGEEEARRCERLVQDSGLEWTIVRAAWFSQNFSEGEFQELVLAGEVALPAGDAAEPFVDVDDIADVVVAALTEPGHAGQLYEVTGPRLLTFSQAVAEIAEASGRDVSFVQIPREAFSQGLAQAGVPADFIGLLDYLFATLLDGHNAHLTDGVQRALGRAPRDFRDFARDVAASGAWQSTPQEA